MVEMGLYARKPKLRYRSYKGEVGKIAPNVLQRDFATDAPNRKWTTDVSQVDIRGKKCYISPILDMWNGEIVSCVISDSPDLQMVVNMLQKAFRKHPQTNGLIMHSDQGWQYQHTRYQYLLREHGITQSMSRKGNCLDNSVMENFFGLMKNELLYNNRWESIEDFKAALKEYIRYYNNERIKLKLKMSPVQYRTHFQNQVK
jgi:putative transposase